MLNKLYQILCFFGVWEYVVLALVQFLVCQSRLLPFPEWVYGIWIFVVPLFLSMLITFVNYEKWKKEGRTDFGIGTMLKTGPEEEYHSSQYREAAYPKIEEKLIGEKPKDLCIGTTREGHYVNIPIEKDGINICICGGVGSGKSILIIAWLLAMLYRKSIFEHDEKKAGRGWNFFLVDVKGEIYRKIMKVDGKYKAAGFEFIHVVDPANRDSFGWDVFYRLRKENITDTDRLKTVMDITEALIPEEKNEASGNAAFFYINARKLFSGIVFFYIKNYPEMSFIEIIHKITRTDLGTHLESIVAEAKEKYDTITLDKLQGFVDKVGNDSISDVEATMSQLLDVFSYPDIEYLLETNPNKTSPAVLNEDISIDLAISESMLFSYKPVFRLICLQVLRHCESEFSEADDRHTMLLFDEAFRIGRIQELSDSLATLRSRHTSIALLFQDMTQVKYLYGELADSILNICDLKIFLSGSGDEETTSLVSRLAGEYTAESKNYKRGGLLLPQSDINYHDDRRPVVDGKSFNSLREKDEVIIFYRGKYFRFKKLRYFEDKYFKQIIEKFIQ